ncbi:putative glycosyl hydrolase 5 (cellulase A) family protein [Lyophyllum shimeji]|uniref:mannan endo-1,4-beta-mannosidase n=1 Tax=Lyophyllum shimeji TaxID=47721 RepID=A0A9P3UKW9_LYOSH|nr:putative glycosyl hydrolase 5 (cellulase A) family protein [Lyophyllum shimeji]
MFLVLWQLFLAALAVSAASPTQTIREAKRHNVPVSPFVTTRDGQFFVNGSVFKFVGTNAYWLHALNTDEDIDNTLAAIRAANFTVVRTWAFNDVDTIPENGTWFQHISNGTLTINDGPNGLQKLDKVVELAQKHGLYLLLSFTNNWSPIPGIDQPLPPGFNPLQIRQLQGTNGTNATLPRNALSNSYGGMDTYVRNFGGKQEHDQFYTNQTLINAFMNYTAIIASRYANHSNVFAWELANDPRCNSSIPNSAGCEARNVTRWHATLAAHVQSVDPNHLVSSGNQGYFCADCPKLFPRQVAPPPPPPQHSPAPGVRRRSAPEPLTRSQLLKERKAAWKRERARQKRSGELIGGVKIRGRWTASQTKRQSDLGTGSAFDGAHGVDSEDIINIPQIGFGSFQLFPDQFDYSSGALDTSLPPFNQTLQIGLDWIRRHAEAGQLFGKPVSLTGFGLVTRDNAPFFVPFNTTIAPFGPDQAPPANVTQPFGVTDEQRDEAYRQWIQAGILGGLQGIIQYQWSQSNLTSLQGSAISPVPTESGQTPLTDTSGMSPNDGYGILGQGQTDALQSISVASQGFGPDSA